MYSNRKPYYQLKKSIPEFFSGYSRFIKQSLDKESVAEKPYQEGGGEYPQMHLNLPVFTYPERKPPKPSAFPEVPGGGYAYDYRFLTVRYLTPTCKLDTWNMPETALPGDIIKFEGDARIPGSTPRRGSSMFNWYLSCSTKFVLLRMVDSDDRNYGQNPDFEALILEGASGTILICAKAWVGGIVTSITWRIIGGLPVATREFVSQVMQTFNFNCGCFEIDVPVELLWDAVNSVEVLGTTDSGIVYIRGGNPPYDWVLTHEYGQGFAITDAQTPVDDRDNEVTTDATAYGRTLITVTDADVVVVSGRVHGNWREDWEADPLSSVHAWNDMIYSSRAGGYLEASVVSFGGEKIVKNEVQINTDGWWIYSYPYINLTVSPEIPLNLGRYSGFECKAYLVSLSPQTFTAANCTANCPGDDSLSYRFIAYVTFEIDWRPIGGSSNNTGYGFYTSVRCQYNEVTKLCDYSLEGGESFATFIARIGSWSSLQAKLWGTSVPWGNSGYEIVQLFPGLYLEMGGFAVTAHGTTNIQAYHSDIVLTPV